MSQPLLASLFDKAERQPLSVSELTAQIRGELEKRFASVWVEGEISNFRAPSSGHWYFTLKDEFAQLRSACYRSSNQRIKFRLEDGMQLRARGRLSVYEQKGEYQLIVESLEPVGAGALQLAFEQTKGRLQAEGAAHEIVRAIRFLNEHHQRALRDGSYDSAIDVMIVGRGGGSIEDLWAFNEEAVARAIRSSVIPVISAVGHETDFTIADFVADLRAATPSAAAEIVATHETQLCSQLDRLVTNLAHSIKFRIGGARAQLQQLALSPAFDEVNTRLRDAMSRADDAEHHLQRLIANALQRAQRRLGAASYSLSPAQLRAHVSAAQARFAALNQARDAGITTRLDLARQKFGLAAAALEAM